MADPVIQADRPGPEGPDDRSDGRASAVAPVEPVAPVAPEAGPREAGPRESGPRGADDAPDDLGGAEAAAASRQVVARLLRGLWAGLWPKVVAVVIAVAVWQVVVVLKWRPEFVLPAPATVGSHLVTLMLHDAKFWQAVATTLGRALTGFATAVVVGTVLGLAVARFGVLRAGLGSLISGLQTMPSITWFPLAILLFGAGEQAISFVVVLGAAPSIAGGVLAGIDQVPPAFTRLGRVLGARGWALQRLVVVPAALPTYVAGLSQGWAFAWRSLMAGELLVIVQDRPSLGGRLSFAQDYADAPGLLAYMVVILAIGMLADAVFGSFSAFLRRRRGLTG